MNIVEITDGSLEDLKKAFDLERSFKQREDFSTMDTNIKNLVRRKVFVLKTRTPDAPFVGYIAFEPTGGRGKYSLTSFFVTKEYQINDVGRYLEKSIQRLFVNRNVQSISVKNPTPLKLYQELKFHQIIGCCTPSFKRERPLEDRFMSMRLGARLGEKTFEEKRISRWTPTDVKEWFNAIGFSKLLGRKKLSIDDLLKTVFYEESRNEFIKVLTKPEERLKFLVLVRHLSLCSSHYIHDELRLVEFSIRRPDEEDEEDSDDDDEDFLITRFPNFLVRGRSPNYKIFKSPFTIHRPNDKETFTMGFYTVLLKLLKMAKKTNAKYKFNYTPPDFRYLENVVSLRTYADNIKSTLLNIMSTKEMTSGRVERVMFTTQTIMRNNSIALLLNPFLPTSIQYGDSSWSPRVDRRFDLKYKIPGHEFGRFILSFKINDVQFEWNENELIIPRKRTSTYDTITSTGNVSAYKVEIKGSKESVLGSIAQFVAKWNTRMRYTAVVPSLEKRQANMLEFAKGMADVTKTPIKDLVAPNSVVARFLRTSPVFMAGEKLIDVFKLRKWKGFSKYKTVRGRDGRRYTAIAFSNHQEFDSLIRHAKSTDAQAFADNTQFLQEKRILVALDRSMWNRYLKDIVKKRNVDEKFIPLPPQRGYRGRISTKPFATGCPFGDPRSTASFWAEKKKK
ncbi:MAG: hypothetical protein ACTSUE_10615 [Promethearchaeota archaeon]